MTKLVGILNVTPDSFSDGGTLAPEAVLAKARQLIDDGADVLDVGAESTRPDATPLSPEEEWLRLAPVWAELAALCHKSGRLLSLDTRHAQTACKALQMGVDWINDVSGFRDEAMLAAVKDAHCALVVMHSLSVPANKGEAVQTNDIAAFMRGWIAQTKARLVGINPQRIIFDPGIGFGKSPQQNWELLVRYREWCGDETLLIGHSRKSFYSLFSDAPANQRDALTRQTSAMLAVHGAHYLRVHDVAGHRQLLTSLRGA